MAFTPSQVQVTGTAKPIWGGSPGASILIYNPDASNTVYLGGVSGITVGASNTLPLGPGQSVSLDGSQAIYAVAPAGTAATVVIPGGAAFFLGLTQAQGALALASFRSPNFAEGLSGWTVNQDGSAEFNNVTIRGGVVVGGTSFQYAGTPAFGNLIESSSATAGTDAHGNAYLIGEVTYRNGASGDREALQKNGYSLTWYTAPTAAGPFTIGSEMDFQQTYISLFPDVLLDTMIIMAPSNDNTGATDGPKINSRLANGFGVYLMPGVYYTNVPIQYPGGAVITALSPQSTIIQATAAMSAVMASTGWLASANTTSQGPVKMSGFRVDANGLATHGIVSQNFWSYFQDLEVTNSASGDDFRFDAFGANGTTEFNVSVTAVENHVTDCQFRSPGAACFRVHDSIVNQHFTDGWLTDCVMQGPGSTATVPILQIDVLAGWKVDGNHLYGAGVTAMSGQRAFNSRIVNNYIEPWGTSTTAGSYAGIGIDGITDGGFGSSVIANNTLDVNATTPGNAASTIDGISCRVTNGASGGLCITGNTISNPEPVAAKYRGAITMQTQSATATMNVVTSGNQVGSGWTNTVDLITNGGVINHTAGV